MQLLSILSPSTASDVAQSLVNDAQQGDGSLPRWEQANADSLGMSGDGGDIVVADAYAFGATNFDTAGALQAMVSGQSHVREGYSDYVSLGYLPADTLPEPVHGLHHPRVRQRRLRDLPVRQLPRELHGLQRVPPALGRTGRTSSTPTSGYVQPRNADGSWAQGFSRYERERLPRGGLGSVLLDGALQPERPVRPDGRRFGRRRSPRRVLHGAERGPNSPYAWMGNEPSVEVPWEYDFAQAPSLTQEVVRLIETQLWSNTPGGMPGNDDGGEMSSWYIFAAMGIYPEIPGVGGFVIGSPLFTSITLELSGGHILQINAPGRLGCPALRAEPRRERHPPLAACGCRGLASRAAPRSTSRWAGALRAGAAPRKTRRLPTHPNVRWRLTRSAGHHSAGTA